MERSVKTKRRIKIGYITVDTRDGTIETSNSYSIGRIRKTKKESIEASNFIKAFFPTKFKYYPVYVEVDNNIKIKWPENKW